MPNPGITDEEALRRITLWRECRRSRKKLEERHGITGSQIQSAFDHAKDRGFHNSIDELVPVGMEIARISSMVDEHGDLKRQYVLVKPEVGERFKAPEGHAVKGVSALVDADGNVVQRWIKTREGELDPAWVGDTLRKALEDAPAVARPLPAPPAHDPTALCLYPLPDLHIGLLSHHSETDGDWDTKRAVAAYEGAIGRLVSATPSCATAVILGLGDLLHADSKQARTERSGNVLDVDTRWAESLRTACDLVVRAVSMALQKHERVVLRLLSGNHDDQSSHAVTFYALAYFRNEPRVEIDCDASAFWHHQHGAVMISATHGHMAKPADMPAVMAGREAEMWGATRFRYAHLGHVHHRSIRPVSEHGGAEVETHQAPVAQDAYHHGQGYVSGRSLCAIVYDQAHGEIARHRVNLSPVAKPRVRMKALAA